ncbi:MAG: hypothetical protein J5662_08375 [Clostridia bacterium]|nr:hypothetical protein [Clostridia bacterium]
MQTEITAIFNEYKKAKSYKESLGEKGLYEQTKINDRFYTGNQWYGVGGSNDRPLVRHNIIKRIGDFKMSQTASDTASVSFMARGAEQSRKAGNLKAEIRDNNLTFEGEVSDTEINAVCCALGKHYRLTALRVDLDSLCAKVLKKSYISGSGVLYTYFDGDAETGLSLSGGKIKGDIACEVLDIEDVYFGAAAEPDVQAQPYVILAGMQDKETLLRNAQAYGAASAVENLKADDDGRVLVLTKLFKVYGEKESTVHCIKVTEDGYLRREYDTRLHFYPLSVFRFGEKDNCVYGESEITYLIPNQIAINRMITASVWSNIATGMPIMMVNGDTVSGEITNDPGQIIKIYGSNEDVAGAVKYISPPDSNAGIGAAVDSLIETTLTQSGANPAILGDERAQNASAISRLQSAALMPLNVLKWRYREFLFKNALIWADFWLNLYGRRKIRIEDENGAWYFPFDANRYRGLSLAASVKTFAPESFSAAEKASALGVLYDKGIITAAQYLSRLPDSLIPEKSALIQSLKEKENEDKQHS